MNTPTVRRSALLIAAGLLILVLVAVLITAPKSIQQLFCEPRFDAYSAPEGTNQFGPSHPDGFATLSDAQARFDDKLSCDPLYAATIKAFVIHGLDLSDEVLQAVRVEASAFIADRQLWAAAQEWIYDQISSYTLENKDVHYETLAMIRGASPDIMPDLTKFDSAALLGQTLVLHMKDGSIRDLRVFCDLQPSVPEFPHIEPPCVTDCEPPENPCPPGNEIPACAPKSDDPNDWIGIDLDVDSGEFTGDDPIDVETDVISEDGVEDSADTGLDEPTGGLGGDAEDIDGPRDEIVIEEPLEDDGDQDAETELPF